jgi:hypothetical protein
VKAANEFAAKFGWRSIAKVFSMYSFQPPPAATRQCTQGIFFIALLIIFGFLFNRQENASPVPVLSKQVNGFCNCMYLQSCTYHCHYFQFQSPAAFKLLALYLLEVYRLIVLFQLIIDNRYRPIFTATANSLHQFVMLSIQSIGDAFSSKTSMNHDVIDENKFVEKSNQEAR